MCSVQLWTSCSSVAYDMAEGWRMVKNHAQLGGCWRSEQARHRHVAIDWYIISITSSCLVYSPSGGERPALEIWVQTSNAEILNIPYLQRDYPYSRCLSLLTGPVGPPLPPVILEDPRGFSAQYLPDGGRRGRWGIFRPSVWAPSARRI